MVKIIMSGCNGKMGQVITGLCKEDPSVEIAAGIDIRNDIQNSYPVYTDFASCGVPADVVVDFSNAAAADALLEYCVNRQMPLVLCTTGLSDEQLEAVKAASEKVAILRSANMSLGINTLLSLLKTAAKILAPAGFDMEIVEKHHNRKLDAPSGTAIAMADAMNSALENDYDYVYDRSGERRQRDPYEIGIQSVRGGNIVGEHEVIFAGTDEVITFKHQATSRAVFGKGALEAAKFLAGKPAGMYSMSDVIEG